MLHLFRLAMRKKDQIETIVMVNLGKELMLPTIRLNYHVLYLSYRSFTPQAFAVLLSHVITCVFLLCNNCRKRLDAELIRRGYTDIPQKRYPIGYQEAPLAYDAVWSVALAFNKTMEQLKRKAKRRTLKDFTYTDADTAGEIYAAMNSTSFLGVSVCISLFYIYSHCLFTFCKQISSIFCLALF